MTIVAMVACSDDGGTESGGNNGGGNSGGQKPQATLSVSATAVNFATEGGEQSIIIDSSAEWTASLVNNRADAWCSIDSSSGNAGSSTLTITATANDTPDERTASVVVKSGSLSKTINVSQKQKDALTVTSSKFEVGVEGGNVVIEVKANIDFEYTIDESAKEWISYEGTRAIKTSTLVFKVAENDNDFFERRVGYITIKSGVFREKIMVYQADREPSIVISQNEYTVSSAGETIAVEVSSNVDVAVEIPDNVDWIAENTTRATSTNTYYFDIAKNEEYDQRTTEIQFTCRRWNNLSEVVTITQVQKDAIVLAKDNYVIYGSGGQIQIEISHNVDFDIEIGCDWITNVDTRALTTETLTFNIAANATEKDREGTIKFVSKDKAISQSILITQYTQTISEIYVEVDCDEWMLRNQIAKSFGSNVISIKKSGKGYLIEVKAGSSIPEKAFDEKGWLKHITIGNGIVSIGNYAFSRNSLASISIPNSVTSIGDSAFAYCSALTSINIPDSVTSIGYEAFADCDALASITIPDSVTSIGYEAFADCDALASITIPNSVTSIGDSAFAYCSALTSINIPDSVTSIGEEAFAYCYALESVTIGNGVTSIGEEAFAYCYALTSINIPDSVTSIGRRAFEMCYALESVTIGNGVTSIGDKTFYDCDALTSITIPNSVTSIGYGVFLACDRLQAFYGKFASDDNKYLIDNGCLKAIIPSELTSCTIPNSVTSIGGYTFYDCDALTSITIPDSVTSIGYEAFADCDALASITIPNSVTSIGNEAFYDCDALTSISIPDSVTSIVYEVFADCDALESVTIGNGVTSIEDAAFYSCDALTSITIPDSVTLIDHSAFSDCAALESVTIGNSVTLIGNYAFSDCAALTSITIPDSVTSIGLCAFADCDALESVTIGNGVTSIEDAAFYSCDALASVYSKPVTPPSISHYYTNSTFYDINIFEDTPCLQNIYVPAGSVDAYKHAEDWCDHAEYICAEP